MRRSCWREVPRKGQSSFRTAGSATSNTPVTLAKAKKAAVGRVVTAQLCSRAGTTYVLSPTSSRCLCFAFRLLGIALGFLSGALCLHAAIVGGLSGFGGERVGLAGHFVRGHIVHSPDVERWRADFRNHHSVVAGTVHPSAVSQSAHWSKTWWHHSFRKHDGMSRDV
jgi:hypothetical protein